MASISQRMKATIDANVPPHLREYMYRMVAKEGGSGGTSSTGAKGPLQFTRGTGKAYGLVGPQGDIREDPVANIQAGVKLTTDNAAILRKHLGREPTFSELALAHQQGADTAGKMLAGTGNAPARNLAVNNVDPNSTPQEAAAKIMNYYGFDKKPGMTLNTGMFDPNAPGAFAAAPVGNIPFAGGFTGPGLSLASNPVAPTAPASFADRMLGGANTPGAKNTPFANTMEGLDQVVKGVNPKPAAAPDMNTIAPMSTGVDQRIAASQPLAQNMLTQMIQQIQARRGVR